MLIILIQMVMHQNSYKKVGRQQRKLRKRDLILPLAMILVLLIVKRQNGFKRQNSFFSKFYTRDRTKAKWAVKAGVKSVMYGKKVNNQ